MITTGAPMSSFKELYYNKFNTTTINPKCIDNKKLFKVQMTYTDKNRSVLKTKTFHILADDISEVESRIEDVTGGSGSIGYTISECKSEFVEVLGG